MSAGVDVPFDGNVMTPRKLSHFRKVGAGAPMWSGACVYDIPGVSPSFSEYESHDPYGDIPDHLDYKVTAGVVSNRSLREPDEPTMTRSSRVAAHFDSAPSARFFQGTANFRWSGMFQGWGLAPRPLIQRRSLVQNANPNMVGSKELHKATSYLPFPPMGSIVSEYGEGKAL